MKNVKSHAIVEQGLAILENLAHRGAVGADPLMGDGCGILVQIPHRFFAAGMRGARLRACRSPASTASATSSCRATRTGGRSSRRSSRRRSRTRARRCSAGATCRSTTPSSANRSRPTEPVHRQVFIASPKPRRRRGRVRAAPLHRAQGDLERGLRSQGRAHQGLLPGLPVARARSSTRACCSRPSSAPTTRTCSDQRFESALALVHQRFSTNTFPSWQLAHPYRMVAHNGEINTLRGNVNWMAARQASVDSALFGDDISKLWPISYEGQSDTACFDNALEFLVRGGYSLAHAMMMLIPEAWAGNPLMDEDRRAFYEYHAALMEPWDGPAAIAFTDGRQIGATLDRNGLRPARYLVTRRRPRGHGLRDGRAADPGGEDRREVAPAARQDAADRPRARAASSPTTRSRSELAAAPSLQGLARAARRSCSRTLKPVQARRAAHRRVAARSPAGLRLHAGGPEAPDGADGDHRPGGGRLDGHRHADLGALATSRSSSTPTSSRTSRR